MPELRALWLAFVGFFPQALAFYLPLTRRSIPDEWAAAALIASQALLLGFAWLNRQQAGMSLLIAGLTLNMTVIIANGGFMPISPQTASRLTALPLETGARLGHSKDILLPLDETRLAWLSDRFLLPTGFPYQVAFSLGDILIAVGVFWLLLSRGTHLSQRQEQ